MNKICLTLNDTDLLKVCEKIRETKDCRLKEDLLFKYMYFNDNVSVYVSYDKDEMDGCVVLSLQNDLVGDLTLFVIYMFIDRKYPKLSLEYMQFVEDRAKELKADKISFTTHRKPEAVVRKYGKYGYGHRCSVIEKRFKKEVV